VCCSALQCVAVCCSVLQCVAVCCRVCCTCHSKCRLSVTEINRVDAMFCFPLPLTNPPPSPPGPNPPLAVLLPARCIGGWIDIVCDIVLQCVAVRCSVLQCVAVCCNVLHDMMCYSLVGTPPYCQYSLQRVVLRLDRYSV